MGLDDDSHLSTCQWEGDDNIFFDLAAVIAVLALLPAGKTKNNCFEQIDLVLVVVMVIGSFCFATLLQ